MVLEKTCLGLQRSLETRHWPLHGSFLSNLVHITTCDAVVSEAMLRRWPSYGSFLSNPVHCTSCGIVLSEAVLEPSALTAAQALTIAWKLPLNTFSLQDVWHCP